MTEIKIINDTLTYDQLYDRLIQAYPDKVLHDFTLDQTTVNNIPKSVGAVFTGKLSDLNSTAEPQVQTMTVEKFMGFSIGERVAIKNNLFCREESWLRSK